MKKILKRCLCIFTAFLISAMMPVTVLKNNASAAVANNQGTADHIDIEVSAVAKLESTSGTLTQNVTFTRADLQNGKATISATRDGESFTEFTANFSNLSTSTSSSGANQIRISGSYPVGTLGSPIKYTLTLKKDVTFSNNETVNISFSATFGYWDSDNTCPMVVNNATWKRGGFIRSSGFDFAFGTATSSRGTIHIEKSAVDENGKTISSLSGQTYDFTVYNSNNEKEASAEVTLGESGKGAVDIYLSYGSYYIVENIPTTSDNLSYAYSNTTINGKSATTSESVTLDANNKTASFNVVNKYTTVPPISEDAGTAYIPFTKIWNDEKESTYRPVQIGVSLYKYAGDNFDLSTATLVQKATISSDWTYNFDISNTDLLDANGNEYKFVVVEDDVELYSEVAHTDPTVHFVSPKANASWDRRETCYQLNIANTATGTHPIVAAKLTAGQGMVIWSKTALTPAEQKVIKAQVLTLGGVGNISNWSFINGNGVSTKYGLTVSDTTIDFKDKNNWALLYFGSYEPTSKNITPASITNVHNKEYTSVTFNKVWSDGGNQDNKRDEQVVKLLVDGVAVAEKTITTADASYTFENLPKCNGYTKKNGVYVCNEIEYVVDEVLTINGYTKTISTNNDGSVTITNSYAPETINITVNKSWSDGNNRDGLRTQTTTIKFCAHGVATNYSKDTCKDKIVGLLDNSSIVFENLPKYNNGELIKYTVTETDILNGYNATGVPEEYLTFSDNKAEIDVVNNHTPETTSITVTKKWEDGGNQDGLRNKYEGKLFAVLKANGTPVAYKSITLDRTKEYTFNDLYKNENGEAIAYTVAEATDCSNNDVSTCKEFTGDDSYTSTIDGLTITNSHTPTTTEVIIAKEWDDDVNRDGLRKNYVDKLFMVLVADDEPVDYYPISTTVTVSDAHFFENLPKNKDGQEIVYTTFEATGCTGSDATTCTKFTGDDDYTVSIDGLTIINTHVPEKTTFTMKKIWDDDGNRDNLRKNYDGNLYLILMRNGHRLGYISVPTDKNEFSLVVDTLEKYYDGGKENVYTVIEAVDCWGDNVNNCVEFRGDDNYSVTLDGTTVTNKHVPATTSITVTKVWDDGEDQDDFRKYYEGKLFIVLSANGKPIAYQSVSTEDATEYTFENLYQNENGEAIAYAISEATNCSNGGASTCVEFTGDGIYASSKDGLTIVNKHKPETVDIIISKTWSDNNNYDGLRTIDTTVKFCLTGVATDYEKTVCKEELVGLNEKSTIKFSNMAKRNKGELIQYSVKEIDILQGYEAEGIPDEYIVIRDNEGKVDVINVHTPATPETGLYTARTSAASISVITIISPAILAIGLYGVKLSKRKLNK